MKKCLQLLAVILLVGGFTTSAFAEPKVIAARFHADWCGSCKTLAPSYDEVSQKLGSKDVLFVTLDKTDDATSNQAKLMADALGIDKAYRDNQKTGFVLLIDGKSKQVMGKLTKAHSAADMSGMIAKALSGEKMMMKGSDEGKMKGSDKKMKKGSNKKGSY